jgi:hypothetical protein
MTIYLVENCALLGYYVASSGNIIQKFRSFRRGVLILTLKDGIDSLSVRNYHYLLYKNPEERSSHQLGGGILKSRHLFGR